MIWGKINATGPRQNGTTGKSGAAAKPEHEAPAVKSKYANP